MSSLDTQPVSGARRSDGNGAEPEPPRQRGQGANSRVGRTPRQRPLNDDTALHRETHLVDRSTRIAGEGRKYWIHLLLASQRPDKLLLMRVNRAEARTALAMTFGSCLRS